MLKTYWNSVNILYFDVNLTFLVNHFAVHLPNRDTVNTIVIFIYYYI